MDTQITKKYCKVCKEEIHPKRVALGYTTTCVKHSTAERYVGFVTETDTETYEVSVVRSKETAKELDRLSKM
jgi:hypothetical protein